MNEKDKEVKICDISIKKIREETKVGVGHYSYKDKMWIATISIPTKRNWKWQLSTNAKTKKQLFKKLSEEYMIC